MKMIKWINLSFLLNSKIKKNVSNISNKTLDHSLKDGNGVLDTSRRATLAYAKKILLYVFLLLVQLSATTKAIALN